MRSLSLLRKRPQQADVPSSPIRELSPTRSVARPSFVTNRASGNWTVLKLGYKLMSEEHPPIDLVRNAQRAEHAGFDFAAISDHYFPWLEEQGHSPLAWPVLGAITHATQRLGLMTAATCPILRYHSAVVAQRRRWPCSATIGSALGLVRESD